MSRVTSPEAGYCQCECGGQTPIAKKTRAILGHVKGEPIPFINGHNRRKQDRYRVEDRGYETPCWTWLLGKSKWGYGLESRGHSQRAAHRWMYEDVHGPVPDEYELDHLCRNRDCVNPNHLEPVIPAVNVQRGDRASLTAEEVKAIRSLLDQGLPRRQLAEAFDVCYGTIGYIARRDTWQNI